MTRIKIWARYEWWIETWASEIGPCWEWNPSGIGLLELVKDRRVIALILEHFFRTSHMLKYGNGKLSIIHAPFTERILCGLWCGVVGGPLHLSILAVRSASGVGMGTDRRVVQPMVSCRVGKVEQSCRVLIYCNSRAPNQRAALVLCTLILT
jgi:hypothetical protein